MTVKILTDTKTFEFETDDLKHPNIYSLIKSIPEIDFIAPCGGGRRCGKQKKLPEEGRRQLFHVWLSQERTLVRV